MDLIYEIRRENGFDQTFQNTEATNTIKALQGNANRGLQKLSDELYSKSTHFLLEFIQNADDNDYADTVVPTLRLKLDNRRIHVECNEVGFTEANVRAICQIGTSTKRDLVGYIGEKGIGFKSVFKVADVVHISSGSYTFKLDRREELGMITPIWTPSLSVIPGSTTFDLELSRSANFQMLSAHLRDIKPSLLLFLRRLRSVVVDGPIGPLGENVIIDIHRDDIDADVVNLKRVENGISSTGKYFLVSHIMKPYQEEERRKNVTESKIVLAFPLADNEAPKIGAQFVHAFLPLRSYGFKFIIQADFLTSTSREDILSDSRWNITLRDAISTTFLAAVSKFKFRPALRYTWFRFLPQNIHDSFLGPVESAIIQILSTRPIFHSADGIYRPPSKFVIAGTFCDAEGAPFIPEEYLPGKRYYLSSPYDLEADGAYFERLGVEPMTNDQFLGGLSKMRSRIPLQSTTWHEAVCQKLYEILHTPRRSRRNLHFEIQQLPLLPLSDESWTSANSSPDLFFDLKLVGIPQDLEIQFVKADIVPASWRYKLFQMLGVREADSQFVANRILEYHRINRVQNSVQSLISHAVFLFLYRLPDTSGLRVMDERGIIAEAKEVYVDIPDSRQSIKMRGVLPSPARFLHPDYLREGRVVNQGDWQQWLCDKVGLNVFPRLMNGGKLSPEFEVFIRSVNSSSKTRTLLIILKETWPQWSTRLHVTSIARLSQTVVVCEDGSKHMLKESYLQRESLKHCPDLPFLPIDDPDHPDWNFLSKLEVTSRVDGNFYLRLLVRLKDEDSRDTEKIEETYRSIEALFHDDPQNIRNSFSQQSLIYHPEEEQWVATTAAVWSGPRSMTSKIPLRTSYPFLKKLFHGHLKLPNAGTEVLGKELQSLSETWEGKVITQTIRDQVSAILVDIADDLVDKQPNPPPNWLRALSSRPIFPIESPSQRLTLCASRDYFYIPDNSGALLAMFSPQVPFLSLSKTTPLDRVKPLFESDIFKSHLKFVEESVKQTSIVRDPQILNASASDYYATRAHYIERYIYSSSPSNLTAEAQDLLIKLRNVTVYDVDSIELTYTLDNFTHTKTEDVILKPESTKFIIQKSKASHDCDLWICTQLAKLLLVDVLLVWACVCQPIDTMQRFFKMQGIPELEIPGDSIDRSRLRGVDADNLMQSQVLITPSSDSQGDTVAEIATTGQFSTLNTHDPPYNSGIQQSKDYSSSVTAVASHQTISSGPVVTPQSQALIPQPPYPFPQTTFSYDVYDTGPIPLYNSSVYLEGSFGRNANLPANGLEFSNGAHFQGAGDTEATESQVADGIAGEYFMYTYLSEQLPGFGLDNWTSELRQEVRGFPPYTLESVADFRYTDQQGVLTAMLYGENQRELWKDRWPTFYLEVKSSRRGHREPFHMSRKQFQTALQMTAPRSDPNRGAPEAIYAIVRVSNIQTPDISWKILPDPHRLFYEGHLSIVSNDVDMALTI